MLIGEDIEIEIKPNREWIQWIKNLILKLWPRKN